MIEVIFVDDCDVGMERLQVRLRVADMCRLLSLLDDAHSYVSTLR